MQDLPHSPPSLNSPSNIRHQKLSMLAERSAKGPWEAVLTCSQSHTITICCWRQVLLPQRSFQWEFCYPVTNPDSRAETQPRDTRVLLRKQQNYSNRNKGKGFILLKRGPSRDTVPQQKFQHSGAGWCLQECHMWVNTDHGWRYLLHELKVENRQTYPFPRD